MPRKNLSTGRERKIMVSCVGKYENTRASKAEG